MMENEEKLIEWRYGIRMLLNPVLWSNFLVGFGIPGVFLGILFAFTGNYKVALLFPLLLIGIFFVIWILVGIVVDIAGGFTANFIITSKGIYFTSGKNAKRSANVATVMGVLAGSAGTTGAGLLAKSEQEAFIEWKDVKKVKVRKAMRYIFIREGFGNKPIGLYCTKENFPKVLEIVRSKTVQATQ